MSNLKTKNIGRKKVIIVLLFLIVVSAFVGFNLRAEYLKILELGENYIGVYNQNLHYKFWAFIGTFFVVFISMYIVTKITIRGLKAFFEKEKKEIPKLANKSIIFIISILVSLLFNSTISEGLALFSNATVFGINDPIFNFDIAYYIFQKPFIETIFIYLIVLCIALIIYTTAYYIYVFNKYFDGIDAEMLKKSLLVKQLYAMLRILAVLLGLFVLVKSQDILYSNFINLNSNSNLIVAGAGAIDATLKLWGNILLAIVIVVSIWLTLSFIRKSDRKKAVTSILIVPGYLIVLFVVTVLYNLIFISGDELDNQSEYINYNIINTKSAYNININEIEIENGGTITAQQVENNQAILNNIPIVDENITLSTLKEYRSNVGYYAFNNTQIARYNDSLVYITPREILTSGLSNTNKTYEYTHGYSAIVTSATETDEFGNVIYEQADFNDTSGEIYISEPRIYFGLETNNNVIINSKNQKEFDYPITTTESKTNNYEGDSGLKLNFLDRIILGIKERNFNILFGKNMTQDSKVLINRQIIKRAQTVMPNLLYDENPYIVVTDEGRLVWVLDAYTVTNKYPYSTLTTIETNNYRTDINYIRNSVKVLVDAYDGTMKFYITDKTDLLLKAYQNMYPGVFEDVEVEIPEDIKKHLVYPEFLYKVQSKLLTVYHNVQPEVLYRNDDVWDIASYNSTLKSTNKTTEIEPTYALVDEDGLRLGLVLPYTKHGNKNITSYLVGTYLDDGTTNLTLYKYSSADIVLGPTQLDRQIEEDSMIMEEIESINIAGTKISKNIIVVPIENTILYIEPIYQTLLNESDIPVLKKVIVASGSRLAIGDNLNEALENLLSKEAVEIEVVDAEDIDDLIELIIKANNNLKNSVSSGNWELTGKDISSLQDLINQLEIMVQEKNEEEDNILDIEEEIEVTSNNIQINE